MTCIVKAYGCSCAAGECQVPRYEILEHSASIARCQLWIAIAIGIAVAGFTFCGFQLANADARLTLEVRT